MTWHVVTDPAGMTYVEHEYAGRALEMAVSKYRPESDYGPKRDRRDVWLGMKDKGYAIHRLAQRPAPLNGGG